MGCQELRYGTICIRILFYLLSTEYYHYYRRYYLHVIIIITIVIFYSGYNQNTLLYSVYTTLFSSIQYSPSTPYPICDIVI